MTFPSSLHPNRRAVTAGLAAGLAAPFLSRMARAQGQALRIGVLLPTSGYQGAFGQSCKRGADIAPDLLKAMGYEGAVELVQADTESNVDVARARAERLISEGCNMLTGPFDSGAAAAIAQVAEQKGVPFVINIAAAPQITEQGYRFVFRNFPTAPQLITNGLNLIKEVCTVTGATPKSAVLLHVNDTFGQANNKAINAIFPKIGMPFPLLDSIAYDPAARDLSVEVAKAKATGADLVMVVTRLNDAILLVREMVKQRWEPMGIVSPGSPGMYEQQFYDTLGKFSDYAISNVPWYNPNSEMAAQVATAFRVAFPNDRLEGYIFNVGFTFEAILVCADAHKRAGSVEAAALVEALKATDIRKRMMVGGPIAFDAKGQCNDIGSACLQNFERTPKVVLPRDAAQASPVFPVPGWAQRG